jgi:hypothetical protein
MRKAVAISMSITIMTLMGCTIHITERIINNLEPTKLYDSYDVKSINLKARSKCVLPPTVNIINAETRVEDYVVYNIPTGGAWVVNPTKLIDGVVSYLKYGFEASKVQIDSNSPKTIRISMKEVQTPSVGNPFLAAESEFQIEVNIPDTKYIETYKAKESTWADNIRAIAYAIHVVTRHIIDDPNIQDYILCTNTNKKLPKGNSALDVLKRRYASGEITREQFEQMKKDIQ